MAIVHQQLKAYSCSCSLKCVLPDNDSCNSNWAFHLFSFVLHEDIKIIELLQHNKHNNSSVLTLKWYVSFLVRNFVIPSISAFFTYMVNIKTQEKYLVERNCPPRPDLKDGNLDGLHKPIVDRSNYIYSNLCTLSRF